MILERVLHKSHWTVSDEGSRLINRHHRVVRANLNDCGQVLEALPGPDSPWPDGWPPLVLDRGLEIGSTGGHGLIRYTVTEHVSGRYVRFDATPEAPFVGWHSFELSESPTGVRWSHTLEIEHPTTQLRLMVVPLHDQLLEELLDNVEARLVGRDRPAARRPLGVRARRRLISALG